MTTFNTFNIPLIVNADEVRDALVEFMKALGLDSSTHWAVNKPITILPLDGGFAISAGLVLTDDDGEIIEHNGDPVSIPVNYLAEEDDEDKWEDCTVCGNDDENEEFCDCDDDDEDDGDRPGCDPDCSGCSDELGFSADSGGWVDGMIIARKFVAGEGASLFSFDVPDYEPEHVTLDLGAATRLPLSSSTFGILNSWIAEVVSGRFSGDVLLISETKASALEIVQLLSVVGGDPVYAVPGVTDTFSIAGRTVHIEDLQGIDDAAVETRITRGRFIGTVLIDGRADLPQGLRQQLIYRTPSIYMVNF